MRHLSILIIVVALTAVGCGKKDDKKKAGSQPAAKTGETAESKAPPPKPFAGELTAERLKQAKDSIKPFQKWEDANGRLLALLGEPTEVDGNNHNWYLLVGDKCHELSVENANGEVGSVGLGEYDKIMKSKFEKCQAVGGEAAKPAEGEAAAPAEGEAAKPE